MGELFGNSLAFAIGAALLSLVVGTTLAYLNVRTDVPFKALFFAASIVPLIVPGILYTVSWIFLASPQIGLLNSVLEPIFGAGAVDIFTIWGMIWVEGLHFSPIVFLLHGGRVPVDGPLARGVGADVGATRVQTLRRVTLPLVRPALLASVLVILITQPRELRGAGAAGAAERHLRLHQPHLLQSCAAIPTDFAGRRRAGGQPAGHRRHRRALQPAPRRRGNKTYQTVTGKGFRPRPMDLGKWRPVVGAGILVYFFVTVVGAAAGAALRGAAALLPGARRPRRSRRSRFDNFRRCSRCSRPAGRCRTARSWASAPPRSSWR